MTRYTAHDYDAAWQVLDNVTGRSVGGSFTEAGALAECERLNALPQRDGAKPVKSWALKSKDGTIFLYTIGVERSVLDPISAWHKDELIRVLITEITGGDDGE